jgi:hypothetical protein
MTSKYTIFDVVQELTRLQLQFSIYEACFWKNEAILYICTISHNAFVVGLVGFIDEYLALKELGNTIYIHNCAEALTRLFLQFNIYEACFERTRQYYICTIVG